MKNSVFGSFCILALLCSSVALGQIPPLETRTVDFTNTTTGEKISGTDTGRWQTGEPNLVIVADGTEDTVVCRFKSSAGNCFRFSLNDGNGHVPVPLHRRDNFDSFFDWFEAKPNMDVCEVIANPWSGWQVQGSIPTGPGRQKLHPSALLQHRGRGASLREYVPGSSQTTRTATVDNPLAVVACVDSWSPSTSTVTKGQRFRQRSRCGGSRWRTGTAAPAAPTTPKCVVTWFKPDPSTIPKGVRYTATTNCGTPLPKIGSYEPPTSCEPNNNWSPARSTVQIGTAFTQTNDCGRAQSDYGSAPLKLVYRLATAYRLPNAGGTDRSGQICSGPSDDGWSATHYLICLPSSTGS